MQGLQGSGWQGVQGLQGYSGLGLQGTRGVSASFAVLLDISNGGSLNVGTGATTTQINSYNSKYNENMSTLGTIVPDSTPIGVFLGPTNSDRSISTQNRVYLSTSSTLYYYYNQANGANNNGWGESPDASGGAASNGPENLILEYSIKGDWTDKVTLDGPIVPVGSGNSWIKRTVTIPTEAKSYSGVYLRFRQTAFDANTGDNWAFTSIIAASDSGSGASGGASGATSFAVIDLSSPSNVSIKDPNNPGAVITRIKDYSNKMATLGTIVPNSTPIGVFIGPVGVDRTVTNVSKVYLTYLDSLYYYYNQANGVNNNGWGESPDASGGAASNGPENLILEYSLTGDWTDKVTLDGPIVPTGSGNSWIKRTVTIPDEARSYSGVYLRFRQTAFDADNGDNWAFTSVLGKISGSTGNNSGSSGGGSTSFAIMDFSNSSDVSIPDANNPCASFTTIANSGYANMATINNVILPSTWITIFNGLKSSVRTVTSKSKVYLTEIGLLHYYYNQANGANNNGWGESPDASGGAASNGPENLILEYSIKGDWTDKVTLDGPIVPVGSGNSWIKRTVTIPTEAKSYSGVYLRFRQTAFDVDNGDNWAFTSIIAKLSLPITDDITTNSVEYPIFSNSTSGILTNVFTSSTKLQYNPSTGTLSSTIFASLSDKTQKTNIETIKNAVELVKQLQGVKYKWIDDHSKPSIGLIAQDTEKVLPEVVNINANGLKSISYGNIVGLLIEAIKEQQLCIDRLEKKINGN